MSGIRTRTHSGAGPSPARAVLPPALALLIALVLTACGGAPNTAPAADAGADATVPLGTSVVLDGSGSSDAEGDELSFAWTVASAPDGSAAAIVDAEAARATIEPDVAGTYQVELTVSDGTATASDGTTITVLDNTAPIADAGPDAVVAPGDEVPLDASGSTDADGDALTYAWSFLRRPTDSEATLDDDAARFPAFHADEPGEYELRLTVSDGALTSVDTVLIDANRAPVADAGDDQDVPVGETARLDASGSSDPDGQALAYEWTVLYPDDGSVTLTGADTPAPSFVVADQVDYLLELTVDDGRETSTSRVTVTGTPAGGGVGATLWVAPDGSDGPGRGTEADPLATVGAALDVAAADPGVLRVRIAPGTYAESFDVEIDRDLALVGPQEADGVAVLDAGAGDLMTIGGDASVSLTRLTLRSDGVALDVGTDAVATLASVVCDAAQCVVSPRFVSDAGGRVVISGSTIRGTDLGVKVLAGEGLTITDSTVEGSGGDGIRISFTPTSIVGSSVVGNDVGLRALAGGGDSVLVMGSTFDGNGVGVHTSLADAVTLRDSTVRSSTGVGVHADNLSVVKLEGSAIVDNGVHGVLVEPGAFGGPTVSLRGTTVDGNAGHAISIHGADTNVNLGTASENGDNTLTDNGGYALNDVREDGATGLVTVSGTSFGPFVHTIGPKSGPDFDAGGIYIRNDNTIHLH